MGHRAIGIDEGETMKRRFGDDHRSIIHHGDAAWRSKFFRGLLPGRGMNLIHCFRAGLQREDQQFDDEERRHLTHSVGPELSMRLCHAGMGLAFLGLLDDWSGFPASSENVA